MSIDAARRTPASPPTASWWALGVLLTANFVAVMCSTVVTVAVPDIRRDLDLGATATVWVLGAYALAYGVAMIPGGRWGDAVGRRRLFLGGMALLAAAALAAALAPTGTVLIAASAVQGLGAGLAVPLVLATIATALPDAARARGFGLYGLATGLGAAVGPLLGGALLAADPWSLGWRSVFGLVAVVAALATAAAVRVVPESHGAGGHVDAVGAVLLTVGLVLVLGPITSGQQAGLDARAVVLVVAGVLVLGGLVGWLRRRRDHGRDPLIDPGLLRVRSFTGATLVALLYFAAFQGLLVSTAVSLQNSGHSALEAGLVLTPMALATIVSSLTSHRLTDRLGPRVLVAGAALVAVGVVLAATAAGLGSAAWVLSAALVVVGLGHGSTVPPNIGLGLRDVPARMAGSAGGAINTAQRIGQSVGVSVVGGLFLAATARVGDRYAYLLVLGVTLAVVVVMGCCAFLIPTRSASGTAPDET